MSPSVRDPNDTFEKIRNEAPFRFRIVSWTEMIDIAYVTRDFIIVNYYYYFIAFNTVVSFVND